MKYFLLVIALFASFGPTTSSGSSRPKAASATASPDLPDSMAPGYEDKYTFFGEWMCHKMNRGVSDTDVLAISHCLGVVLSPQLYESKIKPWNNPYALITGACATDNLPSNLPAEAYEDSCYQMGVRGLWVFIPEIDENLKMDLMKCQSENNAGYASVHYPPTGPAATACAKTYIKKLNDSFVPVQCTP